jgi:hypothetical protein
MATRVGALPAASDIGLEAPLRSNRPVPYFPGTEPETETEEERLKRMLQQSIDLMGKVVPTSGEIDRLRGLLFKGPYG